MLKKWFLTAAVAAFAFAGSANASVVKIDSVTGNHGGQPHGSPIGELITMIDGSGMSPDGGTTNYSHTGGDGPAPATWPNTDPSTWTATSSAWPRIPL